MNRDTESVVALTPNIKLVELTGIEPVASWLQTRRSSQLSYSPNFSY